MPASYGNCPACQHEFEDRTHTCYNPNCPEAQRVATEDASRSTAKATARVDRPMAFSAGGRPAAKVADATAEELAKLKNLENLNRAYAASSRILMFHSSDYRETVDLLLIAAGADKVWVASTPDDVKMRTIVEINDDMASPEAAKAWFQKALELTL